MSKREEAERRKDRKEEEEAEEEEMEEDEGICDTAVGAGEEVKAE